MKGILFTMDAFFGLLIVVALLPLLLLPVEHSSETMNQELLLQAEDAVNAISTVQVKDAIREPVMLDLYNRGVIDSSDLNKTLLEYIGTLWASNSTVNNTYAANISNNLFEDIFPANIAWSLSIENDTIFQSANFSYLSTVSRRVVSGFRKSLPSHGYVASIYLTSIGGKKASSYYFFGGFAGQGNLTAKISVPSDANMSEIYMEVNAGENFSLYVNKNFCSSFNVTIGNFTVDSYTITNQACLNYVAKGENNLTLNFTAGNITNEYIGGGYVRLTYSTTQLAEEDNDTFYYNFPGIDGLINLYDSFYVPGTISAMKINLTLTSGLGYKTFLYVGNTTILNYTGTGQQFSTVLNNSLLTQAFAANSVSFTNLSSTTIPLRMIVLANLTPGNLTAGTDIVLITDVSGSMAWRLNQDSVNGNTINNCYDPNIYLSTTSRISLAKCLDKSFVNAILSGNNSACSIQVTGNNRVGLVSFSTDANTWESLTNNVSYLESKINAYTANGGTCLSCAINRAYNILNSQSAINRTKYIIVMTDGVANYKSTPVCYDFNDVSNITVGLSGATAKRVPPWINVSSTAEDFNAVSAVNSTLIKAVASSGNIYSWNGATWTLDQSLGNALYGISIFNRTLAFAVGASAKIWKWNGSSWQQDQDFGSFDFNAAKFYNSTLAFAVGDGGVIYEWNGTWSLDQDVGSANLYGIDIFSSNLAFAVGDSGKIYKWNGINWSENTDTGSNIHYDVAFLNSTKAFTASSDGRIYTWNGAAWSNTLLSSYALRGVYVVNTTLAFTTGSELGDIYEWNGSWSRTYSKFYYQGNSTTGISCGDGDSCSLNIDQSYSCLNANYSAAVAFTSLVNLTIDSVGFGPVGTCTLGNQTLQEIAKTGNGTFYSSSNGTQLQNIYCQIADNILTKQTQTQQFIPQGNFLTSRLTDSYIEFNYTKSYQQPGYQQITLNLESNSFSGCNGSIFLPYGMNITNALRTSYSGPYWTRTLFVNNGSGVFTVYNLTKYGKEYRVLGDPYNVYIPPSYLAYNTTNIITSELGLNYTHISANCSQNDKLIYTTRLKASVPFGSTFPKISGSVVRIYYDKDHDSNQDGYTDIVVGADLPVFNSTVRTTDMLDSQNALDDAIIRLLNSLNFVQGPGVAGSITNPIDVQLSNIDLSTAGTGSIPFAWGPLDVKIGVGI
ncbi:MAG: VWA domain-containing protein [Candidatus Aenigmarchaeota archaeon]|nr:VWA domain-containing protein [Candidatus Aenigmarchaeota archaeon]